MVEFRTRRDGRVYASRNRRERERDFQFQLLGTSKDGVPFATYVDAPSLREAYVAAEDKFPNITFEDAEVLGPAREDRHERRRREGGRAALDAFLGERGRHLKKSKAKEEQTVFRGKIKDKPVPWAIVAGTKDGRKFNFTVYARSAEEAQAKLLKQTPFVDFVRTIHEARGERAGRYARKAYGSAERVYKGVKTLGRTAERFAKWLDKPEPKDEAGEGESVF